MSTKQHPNWNEFVGACCTSQSKAEYLLRCHPELLEARRAHVEETPLHWLTIENRLEAVQFLVRMGANVNTRCAGESTPLQHAAGLDHVEMVRFLLAHGADPNTQDDCGWTALHWIAKNPKKESIKLAELLLEAGADALITDISGDTPVDLAASGEYLELAALMKRHGQTQKAEDKSTGGM